MPNRQPRRYAPAAQLGPTRVLLVVAFSLGVITAFPAYHLHAAGSPQGEPRDENPVTPANDSEVSDTETNDAQTNDGQTNDSQAGASETDTSTWPAEWITNGETISVSLLPGDGLTLRRQENGRAIPLADDATGRLRLGDSADAGESASRPTVSPLHRHRARIETRRKAAMRGAWSPEQDGHRGPPDEDAWKNAIHLRGGDTVDGRVVSIDPSGVRFRSSRHGTATIPHDRVERLELDLLENPSAASLDDTTRRRLSTVPRMQTDTPPTQILVSPSADYLRCRLTSLDDTGLTATIHGGTTEIPRDAVAQIIWLHPDSDEAIDSAHTPATQSPATRSSDTQSSATRFRVTRWDGERLTLSALRVEAGDVIGHSESFGECRFRISELTEIAVGDTLISQPDPTVEPWRAIPATLPIADQQDVPLNQYNVAGDSFEFPPVKRYDLASPRIRHESIERCQGERHLFNLHKFLTQSATDLRGLWMQWGKLMTSDTSVR